MSSAWDRRSVTQQRRVKTQTAKRWLPQVMATVPLWADHASRNRVVPSEVRRLEDLALLPPVRRRDLIHLSGPEASALVLKMTDRTVKERAAASVLKRVRAGLRRHGPEGKRRALLEEFKPVHMQHHPEFIPVASTRSDLDRLHLIGARTAQVLGLSDRDYGVWADAPAPSVESDAVRALGLGSSMLVVQPRRAGEGLTRVVDAFELVPMTFVIGSRDVLVELANQCRPVDVDARNVHTVVVTGPPLRDDERSLLRDAWQRAGAAPNVRVRALWGPVGARHLWAEALDTPGEFVTHPDLEHLELVDPLSGQAVAEGGDLTITTLGWHGTVLLRYQTGVYVDRIESRQDPVTGRTVPRLAGSIIPNAWEPTFSGATGKGRIDLRDVAVAMQSDERVEAWRVELRGPTQSRGHDRYLVELAGRLTPQDLVALSHTLSEFVGQDPAQLVLSDSVATVDQHAAQHGSVFADLRR